LTSLNPGGTVRERFRVSDGERQMPRSQPSRDVVFTLAAVATVAVLILGCPLSMIAHAQMTSMMDMDEDMPAQGMAVMCPMPYGVPAHPVGHEAGRFVLESLPVHLDPNPAPMTRPIFHPPTVS